jgi:cell division protein FtsB
MKIPGFFIGVVAFFAERHTITSMKESKGRWKYLVLVVSIILVITYYTVFGERGVLELRKLERTVEEAKAKTEEVKKENERLKQEIQRLQSDQQYIEKLARQELGLARKDEMIYKKVTPSPPAGEKKAKIQ